MLKLNLLGVPILSKVIFYTETKGSLQGHLFPILTVEGISEVDINAKLALLTEQGYQGLCVGSWIEISTSEPTPGSTMINPLKALHTCEDTYKRLKQILPSKKQTSTDGIEGFQISEHVGSGVYNFFIRLEDKFFKIMAHSNASMHDLVKVCKSSIEAV